MLPNFYLPAKRWLQWFNFSPTFFHVQANACATYNFLLEEGRVTGAALVPPTFLNDRWCHDIKVIIQGNATGDDLLSTWSGRCTSRGGRRTMGWTVYLWQSQTNLRFCWQCTVWVFTFNIYIFSIHLIICHRRYLSGIWCSKHQFSF